MKTLFTALLTFTAFCAAFSQAPQSFSYQAVARNSSGAALTLQNVSFRISLVQGTINGSPVYSETHSLKTNDFGIVNLSLIHISEPTRPY